MSLTLEQEIAALIAKRAPASLDLKPFIQKYLKNDIDRIEEIKLELETVNDTVRETLGYTDMSLADCESQMEEYDDLTKERSRLKRKIVVLEEFADFVKGEAGKNASTF